MAKGTGIYNFDAQTKWLDNYEMEQSQLFQAAHPDKTEAEHKAYQAGIRAGWNKCRSTLVFHNIIQTNFR